MSGILNLLLGSAAGVIKDAYFNLVTLLLNTTATNGAQNNTFLDSSTNNFSITRNGNTTQGTFTPFSQTGWSNYFTGSAGLTTNSNAGMGVASGGDVTIEVWLNTFTTATNGGLGDSGNSICGTTDEAAWNSTSYGIILNSTGICLYNGNGGGVLWSMSCSINDGKWHHVAVVRSSGTWQTFIDGTSIGTTTTQGTRVLGSDTYRYAVGTVAPGGGSGSFLGYLSNFRFTKSAVYTSNFTPSTTPLTAITNTALLTLQSNRFLDNSSSPKTFTVYGTPSVQAFSPFVPTTAYSTSLVGGSAYSGTTSSTLSVNSQPLINISDWTVEFWMYPTQYNNNGGLFGASNGGGTNPKLYFYVSGSNLQLTGYSGGFTTILANAYPALNQWTYVSVSRSSSSGNAYLYYNGVLQQTGSIAAITGITNPFYFFSDGEGASPGFYGYMSNARVSNTARYTGSNYSIPTALNASDGSTRLLTNFTNAGIYDSAAKNDLETVGNAQVSTTQAKFGTTSISVDGTGDWLVMPSNPGLNLGSGAYTIEFFYRPNEVANDVSLIGKYGSEWLVQYLPSAGPAFRFAINNNSVSDFTSTLSANTWYHIAVCRDSSGNLRMFKDGTQIGSTVTSGSGAANNITATTNPLYIGTRDAGTQSVNGYFDEVRITKGYARYTANFTAPTAAFPIQ